MRGTLSGRIPSHCYNYVEDELSGLFVKLSTIGGLYFRPGISPFLISYIGRTYRNYRDDKKTTMAFSVAFPVAFMFQPLCRPHLA